MQKSFKAVFKADENTKIGNLGNCSMNNIINLVSVRNISSPRIVLHLLQAQRDTPPLLINREHLALNLLTLINHFTWMGDFACPRHICDMEEAIDPFINFDEGSIICQISNNTLNNGAWWVICRYFFPRILLRLFHAQ